MMKNKNTIKLLSLFENDQTAIDIPENTSYKDFAKKVADILKRDYGKHNFQPFLEALIGELKKNE